MEVDTKPLTKESSSKENKGLPIWVRILSFIFTIVAIIYSVRNRTLEDFIQYGSYFAIGLFIIIAIVVSVLLIKDKPGKPKLKAIFFGILIIILVLIFGGIAYYSVFALIKDTFSWIVSPKLSKNVAIILSSTLTLVIGLTLFYFRLRARAIYGLTEAAVGLIVASNRVITQMDQLSSSTFYLAFLTASVYLVVRGFDNIHQGLYRQPVDPYGKKLFEFLKKRW